MNIRKTLGLCAASAALLSWHPVAHAQEGRAPDTEQRDDVEVQEIEVREVEVREVEVREAPEEARVTTEPEERGAIERLTEPLMEAGIDLEAQPDIGAVIQVGGGVRGFVGQIAQEFGIPGGYWDVRGVYGTRNVLGGEAAYTGSAQGVDAIGLSNAATLVSNGLEGAARVNAPLAFDTQAVSLLLEPYALAGIGAQYYSVVNSGVNTANLNTSDWVLAVPVGVGVLLGAGPFTLDGRFMYRQTFFNDLIGGSTTSFSAAALNAWQFGAALGIEF